MRKIRFLMKAWSQQIFKSNRGKTQAWSCTLFVCVRLLIFFLPFGLCGCKNISLPQENVTITVQLPQWPPQVATGTGNSCQAADATTTTSAATTTTSAADNSSQSPTPFPPLSRWKVLISRQGGLQESFIDKEEKSVEVTAEKNEYLSILVWPVTLNSEGKEINFFKPAGFIYPFLIEETGGNYQATWNQGFLAHVMGQLYRAAGSPNISEKTPDSPSDSYMQSGTTSLPRTAHLSDSENLDFILRLNWKKIQNSIDKKIREEGFNPWLLNEPVFFSKLCSGDFSTSIFKNTGCGKITKREVLDSYLSSFIPENSFTQEEGPDYFLVVKKKPEIFYDGKNTALFINYISPKNISLETRYMPIFIEGL